MTTHMTPSGKEALRRTIRGLREVLLSQLKEEAERNYRLGVPLEKAKLAEARAKKRARLEAWMEEQARAEFPAPKKGAGKKSDASDGAKKPPEKKLTEKQLKALRERYLEQAVKEAAHTLINRLVIVRLMEAGELSRPAVVTGGWNSPGYREFQEYAGALCRDAEDGTKGYAALLQALFDELSVELPGVFGQVGLTSLFPIPAATLREAIEALNDAALESVWRDDTTLGWVYQFWNDPEREALDEKINGGGKIEPHEIASKTQMFTERYMVEWLLQNSLGQTWLAMCKKNGFTPEFESVRASLEARRAEWRKKREAGEVAPDELMPLYPAGPGGDLEEHWKYWVPQPLPQDAPAAAPKRLLDLKLLDPACGSGHFLVIAFDLLGALYLEEARARGEEPEPVVIAADILEHNLHGVDIDARAIQIAAAALYLKAKLWVKEWAAKVQSPHDDLRILRMNLVAPHFKLGALPKDDAALALLKKRLKVEVGIPESLTEGLVGALEGVDHLGTLLRVDKNVRDSLAKYEKENFGITAPKAQTTMFGEETKEKIQLSLDEAEANVTEQLARFLDAHEGESDLGLRLEGEQLAAGVRFLQIVREGTFDVVVGNPPYQGTSKMAEADWFKKHYPRSKADLYACFLERGLELAKPGGVSALLTMRGWMFLSSYEQLRTEISKQHSIRLIADLQYRAFSEIGNIVVAMSVIQKGATETRGIALRPRTPDRRVEDMPQLMRNIAGLEFQDERFEFDVAKLAGIDGTPLVYWWSEEFLEEYVKAPKLGEVAPVRQGLATGDNARFTRKSHEVHPAFSGWSFYIKGAAGQAWCEPADELVNWHNAGVQLQNFIRDGKQPSRPQNVDYYFQRGIAFSMIGAGFVARTHRFESVFGHKGSSAFPPVEKIADVLCLLNSSSCRAVLQSLNPGIGTEVGDVLRAPLWKIDGSTAIKSAIDEAFTLHESHREPSVEFKRPGPSPWRYAQDWAQRAVDRPKGEPLPPYEEQLDPPEPTAFVSFAIGVALGRFGENGEGILDLSLDVEARKQAPPMSRSDEGAPSTATDYVGGAGAHAVGGEEEPEFTSGDGGGLYPLKKTVARGDASGSAEVNAVNTDGAAGDRMGADGAADGRAEKASRVRSKALSGEDGPTRAGAPSPEVNAVNISGDSLGKSAGSSHGVSNQTDLAHRVRDARVGGEDALDVPNIEPSPLPDGQEILPYGILFISLAPSVHDSTRHPAYARIENAWSEHGAALTNGKKTSLEEWLAKDFFSYHKSLYENRPIYFPLTSSNKSFVAHVSIHRWEDNTLQALLANYLHPAREKLQGEINDINQARVSSDKKAAAAAEKQYDKTQKLFEELEQFIAHVTQIAEKGAPPTETSGKNACPPREVDAPFKMDLDDGVMINSAALWPLLEPQWKDPKKWWKELCTADGRKDYDWAHLAARYFPTRVDAKCKTDPSLGVAHGCFWKYHPAKAYAWELRLQDEIGAGFTIDEAFPQMPTAGDPGAVAGELQAAWFGPPGPRAASDKYRADFLRDHPKEAAEIRAKEEMRRERSRKKGARAEDDEDAQGDQASFQLRAE